MLNIAMCRIKLGDFVEAKSKCTDALAIDPDNVKGLYRRASALLETKDFEEASALQ